MINRRSFLGSGAALFAAAGCTSVCGTGGAKGSLATGPAAACPRAEGLYTTGKVPFKLGMAGFSYHRVRDVDALLDSLQRLDVRNLCIKDFHLPLTATTAEIATFKKKCADHGVTGYAVGPIYMATQDEAKKAFDYAAAIGVKTVVGVPYLNGADKKYNSRTQNRALCEFLSDLCDQYKINYAIHNHGPDAPNMFPTGKSVFEFVRDLSPRMGLCLDIGHDFRFNMDPADSIRLYHSRIFDLHLKNVSDNSKAGGGRPLPRGKIDLVDVVKALCEVNYTGCCSLEYEVFPPKPAKGVKETGVSGVNEIAVAECIGYFRALMDSVRA